MITNNKMQMNNNLSNTNDDDVELLLSYKCLFWYIISVILLYDIIS